MKNEKLYPKEKQKGVIFYRNKLASQDMSETRRTLMRLISMLMTK